MLSLLAAALTLAADCDLERPDGSPACVREEVDALKINALQAIGTHNSYKVAIAPAEMALLASVSPGSARSLDYAHRPLAEQLDDGARQLEIDIVHDPEGGRYADPAIRRMVKGTTPYDLSPLKAKGLKVMHVPDIDYRSVCPTFVGCLSDIRAWSRAHPDHVPILILLNLKEGATKGVPGAVEAPVFDAAAMDAVDAEIRSVFAEAEIITPDSVQGTWPTLREAAAAGAWPSLGAARGKVMFALDAPRSQVDVYRGARRSLEGRAMFVNIEETEDAAGYITLNEPKDLADRIARAVAAGLIVRTRADSDTDEARDNDTARRRAAFASGAHYVSTDYMVPDTRFSDYVVRMPNGGAARLNPVSGPDIAAGRR